MKDPTAARHSPPPGSEEELRGLLASLPEKAAVRGMLFNAVLEVMRQSDGETAVQQCLAVTGEKTFLDYFSYPPGKYLELLYAAARLHSGGREGFERALRYLGQQSATNFLVSAAGRTLLVLVQGDPYRLLNRLPWAILVGVSGVEVSVRPTGPWSGILTVKRDFSPRPYVEGGFLATFEAARVKGAKVRSWQAGPHVNEYELSWE
ncbi:DUF2378 family protein [Archangium lansingense]|uniref:DUF2378 family protein n=1 Tax=Archangium lansingense TaxID=2995310 RepID=A0ABT3ZZ11_9BACT|nr:DUF2378 family protein [Archangium lansinium]MCY1074641.1 DUF2378 family protein [Archangium lansinium]